MALTKATAAEATAMEAETEAATMATITRMTTAIEAEAEAEVKATITGMEAVPTSKEVEVKVKGTTGKAKKVAVRQTEIYIH